MFVAHGFLSPEECAALRRSAEAGELPRLEYDNVSTTAAPEAATCSMAAGACGCTCLSAVLSHGGTPQQGLANASAQLPPA